MESNDDVTFCATVDFFLPIVVFAFFNTFVDEAAKTGGGRRREGTAAADDDGAGFGALAQNERESAALQELAELKVHVVSLTSELRGDKDEYMDDLRTTL